jgi:hypothetical protein
MEEVNTKWIPYYILMLLNGTTLGLAVCESNPPVGFGLSHCSVVSDLNTSLSARLNV